MSARYRLCLNNFFFDSSWATKSQSVVTGRLWRFCLVAIGSVSSLIYPHAPLVSFATVAGVTLNRQQAVVSALLIWFVNQFSGFTIRQYPFSPIALLWGVVMGLATVAVVLIASIQPRFSHRSWLGYAIWLSIALLLGFAVYQSSTLFVNQWVGMHGLTANVFGQIFGRELIWTIALFGLHTVWVNQPHLRQTQR